MRMKSDLFNMNKRISRRNFVKVGGAVIAGTTFGLPSMERIISIPEENSKIKRYRILGRTGFKASDIGMGCGGLKESTIVRYVYDKGINYFDTAESYGNGESERKIGEALKFMDRKKVFITTKLRITEKDTKETILERFQKCQERLTTKYIDALYMHKVADVSLLNHSGFHATVKQLKSEGRLKHAGLSSHGPRGRKGDSMEKVLCAAAEDGRFDLMLFVYNFMNKEAGEKVLAACKKHNIGTTAMKTSPGMIKVDPFDPENPTIQQEKYIKLLIKRGLTREKAIERIQRWVSQQLEEKEKTRPFREKYDIKTEDHFRKACIQWVLQNPDLYTVCVSLSNFDLVDKIIPLSGTKLSQTDRDFLKKYKLVYNDRYCRHGCNTCVANCPHHLPVSTIMRYVYYYQWQSREKYAMQKYANLNGWNASLCIDCDTPCQNTCPYNVDVQANLLQAHSLLTLV